MDKVVHTSEGKLLVGDPLKTVGTKLRYKSLGDIRDGVVTERALVMYSERMFEDINSRAGDRAVVWASWGGFNSDNPPTFVDRRQIIFVETP